MLVLSRRIGEEIVIAGNIRVTVVEVKGRITRLGFTAPASVSVVRRELLAGCSAGEGSPVAWRDGNCQGRGIASTEPVLFKTIAGRETSPWLVGIASDARWERKSESD